MSRPITTFCLSLLLLAACSRTPEIVPQGLPDATVSEVFLVRLGAERGKGTLTWSLAEGELPEGLVLNPAGVISGTPERSGSYAFTLTVEDQRGRTDQRAHGRAEPQERELAQRRRGDRADRRVDEHGHREERAEERRAAAAAGGVACQSAPKEPQQ